MSEDGECKVKLTEEQAKLIMMQLLLSVDFMHKSGIVHRDIKLENILINQIQDNQHDVRIADLGLSTYLPGVSYYLTIVEQQII